jgi:hypothetical protein
MRSKAALRRELAQIRQDALAVDDQELRAELLAIAAPVRCDTGDTVAAVGMTAHMKTISLGELVDALGPHLISTADRIAARLGHRRADEMARGGRAGAGERGGGLESAAAELTSHPCFLLLLPSPFRRNPHHDRRFSSSALRAMCWLSLSDGVLH